MPEHEWSGSKLRFQKPGGGWGAFVELCGPKGANGASGGFYSRPSGVGFDPTQLPLATTAVPAEFLVQQGGQWARATYAQMQAWFAATPVPDHGYGLMTESGEFLLTEAGEYLIQEAGAADAYVLTELGGALLPEAGGFITQELT